MATIPENVYPLLAEMANGALVLTPNHRTCAQLRRWFAEHIYSDGGGKRVYRTPASFPIDIWIRHQHDALLQSGDGFLAPALLLESAEEKLLWQRIIRESGIGAKILNQTATANAVQEAWTTMHLWKIPRTQLQRYSFSANPDQDDLGAFLHWSAEFQKFCDKHALTTLVQVADSITRLVTLGHLALPPRVIFSGFRQPPPLYKELLSALEAQAGTATWHDLAPQSATVVKLALPDTASELMAAAQWAKHQHDADKNTRIGVIVPNLHGSAQAAQRIFSRAFSENTTRSLRITEDQPFEISVHPPASSDPLLKAALLFLSLNDYYTQTLDVCQVLRSPFLAAAESEETSRAELEILLRRRNEPALSNADLRFWANQAAKPYSNPVFAGNLLAFDEARPAGPARQQSLSAWVDVFERQLVALGWPGERQLSMTERDALDTWSGILANLKRNSHLHSAMSILEALDNLRRLADITRLKHRGDNAAVLVLTPLEAEGLRFNQCWLTGMSERQWPPAPSLSPFIPYALQRQFGIPDADIVQLTDNARQFLEELRGNTENALIISHPLQDDEVALQAAAQILTLPGEFADITPYLPVYRLHPLEQRQQAGTALEILADVTTVNVAGAPLPGGGYLLLADQAECPFRGFINHRLGARPLEKLTTGLSARDAGTLVHGVLESFWKTLQSQANLLATPEEELAAMVDAAIDASVRDMATRKRNTMTDAFCRLERLRLRDLLWQWLDEERKRGAFTVLENECDVVWREANLELDLRIDRIDLTADGALVLVDYKTSRSTSVDWEDTRPGNPQLMLYSLALEQSRQAQTVPGLPDSSAIGGLYFAQVNIEKPAYKGLAALPGIYPGSSIRDLAGKHKGLAEDATWAALREHWQTSLAALVTEFMHGLAVVAPRNPYSCTYCPVKPVCRVEEVIEP